MVPDPPAGPFSANSLALGFVKREQEERETQAGEQLNGRLQQRHQGDRAAKERGAVAEEDCREQET